MLPSGARITTFLRPREISPRAMLSASGWERAQTVVLPHPSNRIL